MGIKKYGFLIFQGQIATWQLHLIDPLHPNIKHTPNAIELFISVSQYPSSLPSPTHVGGYWSSFVNTMVTQSIPWFLPREGDRAAEYAP